jgi:glycosyltransferase involved in cell wall biosynthesis
VLPPQPATIDIGPLVAHAEPPEVSVVIPVRNGAATIADQLVALATQVDAPVFEVIVSDNGSTDSTRTVVAAVAHAYRLPVRIVDSSQRSGVSHARNAGTRAARADIVLICDADDIVGPTWVGAMSEALEYFDVVGGPLEHHRLNPDIPAEYREDLRRLPQLDGTFAYAQGANFGTRRGVIDAIGGWDETYDAGADDADFSVKAQLAGFSLAYVPDAPVHYRLRSGLTATFMQTFKYGRETALLYKRFRPSGVHPKSLGETALAWLLILGRAPRAVLADRAYRRHWLTRLGGATGRLWGSVKYRTLAP